MQGFSDKSYANLHNLNLSSLLVRYETKHKEFMRINFQGSADNFIVCAVMTSWFIFVDSKQPQNP